MKKVLIFLLLFTLIHLPLHAKKPLKLISKLLETKNISVKSIPSLKLLPPGIQNISEHGNLPVIDNPSLIQEKIISKLETARFYPDYHVFQPFVNIDPDLRFSGTVFKLEYNGKKEIYGVVATHIVSSDPKDPFGVARRFNAVLYKKGVSPQKFTAEIVAASPANMLDIALVKFPKDIEPLLQPYSIASDIDKTSTLHSISLARWGFIYTPNRLYFKRISFRSSYYYTG